jgi:hypothetical protein
MPYRSRRSESETRTSLHAHDSWTLDVGLTSLRTHNLNLRVDIERRSSATLSSSPSSAHILELAKTQNLGLCWLRPVHGWRKLP